MHTGRGGALHESSSSKGAILLLAAFGFAGETPDGREITTLGESLPISDGHDNELHAAGLRHQRIRAVTFNAALAPGFAPHALERAPRVIAALTEASNEADVMCVQEFWLQQHFDALTAGVTQLPHTMRMEPRSGSGNCSESEFLPLASCLGANCGSASHDALADCASANCSVEVTSLSGGCLGCILDHMDGIEACLGDGQAASDPAIFGGAFDVGLLSRWPFGRTRVKELTSYFVRVSVLHAQIAVPKLGSLDVFCTHLGSPLGIIPYAGTSGGWEQEHAIQVAELLEFVRDENGGRRPSLVLGDLNCGPALPGIDGVWQGNYAMLTDAGLANAYAASDKPLCTNCAGTSFRDVSATNEIIDHVFSVRLPWRHAESKRLFLDTVELGPDGASSNLSDHFGLKTTFAIGASPVHAYSRDGRTQPRR